MTIAGALLIWLLVALLLLLWCHGATLKSLWSEPVLRHPILVFESDDWGPADPVHARRLQQLADILQGYQDSKGHHPVMTLGVVLAIPDRRYMLERNGEYIALTMADGQFSVMREVIERGVGCGVFSLQLHGKEHYWPPSLIKVAKKDEAVAAWLHGEYPRTELLPPFLQSRWIDASTLPSHALANTEIEAAVNEEVALFTQIFNRAPTVVVPPTFVWTAAVERVWALRGIRILVTPGRRFEQRDERGKVSGSNAIIRNGMRSPDGMIYVVRDDYFEPAKGHRAEHALAALQLKTRCGRPTLLETHRFNYVDDSAATERAYAELSALINNALQVYPNLRFVSTEVLGNAMLDKQDELIEGRGLARVLVWCWRVRQEAAVWRLTRLVGLSWVLLLMQRSITAALSSMKKTT